MFHKFAGRKRELQIIGYFLLSNYTSVSEGFLALDLLYRKVPDADVMLYLLDCGFTRREFDWFMLNDAAVYQIMGNDYYGRNEQLLFYLV